MKMVAFSVRTLEDSFFKSDLGVSLKCQQAPFICGWLLVFDHELKVKFSTDLIAVCSAFPMT